MPTYEVNYTIQGRIEVTVSDESEIEDAVEKESDPSANEFLSVDDILKISD